MRLVLGEGLRLAAIGAAIGIGGVDRRRAAAAGRCSSTPPRGIRACSPPPASIMIAVAALAAFVPARRAGAVDPIVVLRND